jgi:hypothetical protein
MKLVGDKVVFHDWVDLTRLKACKINDYFAEDMLRHKGAFVVVGQAESGSGYFEGPWLRVQYCPGGSGHIGVYVRRCYFQLAPPDGSAT